MRFRIGAKEQGRGRWEREDRSRQQTKVRAKRSLEQSPDMRGVRGGGREGKRAGVGSYSWRGGWHSRVKGRRREGTCRGKSRARESRSNTDLIGSPIE